MLQMSKQLPLLFCSNRLCQVSSGNDAAYQSIRSGLFPPTFAVLRRGLIGDMTVPDPEALRRGVDTDGAIKQAMWPLRPNVTRLL